MRLSLEGLVDEQWRREIGSNIVDAYRRRPQTAEELAGLDAATHMLVEEEPWRVLAEEQLASLSGSSEFEPAEVDETIDGR